jgi:hypothetical protein
MSDSFRLGLGLVCMFFAGWFTLATLLTAKNVCLDFLDRLRYRQRIRAEIWPSDWNSPASFRELERLLREWLAGGGQGLHER